MKNFIFRIVLILVLSSCNKSAEKKVVKTNAILKPASVTDTLAHDETLSQKEFKSDFDILLPRSYRTYGDKNPAASLTEKWIDLYQENGNYYLGKADFKIEKSFDECSGDSLQSIIPKNKTIIFIDNPELKEGKIKFLKINKDKIWPKEKVIFTFNNLDYILRGEGKVLSEEDGVNDEGKEETFKKVQGYKLYLTIGVSKEKLLLTEESFNDTFVKLLFAGDIDGDGKLDFIFSANRDYEEERVILFLSSKATNKEEVKKVAEIAVQFDC